MKKSLEKYDICQFCESLWGEDKHSECTTPCTCASYINQDYVYQKEMTIGLPSPRSIRISAQISTREYWGTLSIDEKRRIALKIGQLANTMDKILFEMVALLLDGNTKEDICQELQIEPHTYDTYADKLREEVKI
jgi:hypothetical protein